MRFFCKTLLLFLILSIQSLSANIEPVLIGTIKSDTLLTLFGYRIIPLGDQNNDGFDDILTWDYRFTNYLYYGGNPFDSMPTLRFDSTNSRTNNLGDINGDSFDDFSALGRSQYGWKLNVYYGGPSIDTVRDLWFGDDTARAVGNTVHCQDINNNGTDELISWTWFGGAVNLFELNQQNDTLPFLRLTPANIPYDGYTFGEGIISGDFNGDGISDIGVSLRRSTQQQISGSVYFYWGGAEFDTIPDLIIRHPGEYFEGTTFFGELLENLSDINGDGYDDIMINSHMSSYDTLNYIYFGGPNIDTLPDVILTQNIDRARTAGDINNDGYVDLITSHALPFSGAGHVLLFYGGPTFDSIPDFTLTNRDFEGYQINFGMDCSGIGDFNGDGIDDFAFSAIDGGNFGMIFIYSGWDISTEVEYEFEPNIPDIFTLEQNYPNPFNPSTTIKFNLPTKSNVIINIYNLLGQQVQQLVNQEYSAGNYKVTWDGTTSDGVKTATGIYFYRIETDNFMDTKKMLFLK